MRFCLILLILISSTLNAQNFEWLKHYGSKTRNESIIDLVVDGSGNCTFLLNVVEGISTNFKDSFKLDSLNISLLPGVKSRGLYIVTIDKNNKIQRTKYLGNFYGLRLLKDTNKYSYVSGIIQDTNSNQVYGKIFNINNGRFLILKLDSLFNNSFTFIPSFSKTRDIALLTSVPTSKFNFLQSARALILVSSLRTVRIIWYT